MFDLEMMKELGYCQRDRKLLPVTSPAGIKAGVAAPFTLIDYFPRGFCY